MGRLVLDTIVIGAGIGGLSMAICLAKKGHRVRVLEGSQGLSEFGAGIQVAPNATVIFHTWGVRGRLEEYALKQRLSKLRRYSTGEELGVTHMNPDSEETYGSPYYQIYRPDFQRILAEYTQELGIKIVFSTRVTRLDCTAGELTLENGTHLKADLIVCADGIRSTIRPQFPGNEDSAPQLLHDYTYRATVPEHDMRKDPETAALVDTQDIQAFLGPGRAVVAYPISKGKLFNFAVSAVADDRDSLDSEPVGLWNEPTDVEEFRQMLSDFCPLIQKILHVIQRVAKWTIAEVPPLATWSHGKAVLIGDAAHAMSPHAAQGSAMAVEDAAVLGECLDTVAALNDLPAALKKYETIRRPRVERVANLARNNGFMWVMPNGPEQEARDQRFRAVTKDYDRMLKELGREGMKVRPKPKADMHASWPQPSLFMWLFGFDAIQDARQQLSS